MINDTVLWCFLLNILYVTQRHEGDLEFWDVYQSQESIYQ